MWFLGIHDDSGDLSPVGTSKKCEALNPFSIKMQGAMRTSSSVFLLICLAVPALAEKRARVAIEAPPPVTRALNAAIAKSYTPVSTEETLGIGPSTAEIKAAVAAVDAVALVLASRAGASIVLTVYGVNGLMVDTIKFKNASRKPLKTLPKTTPKRLLAALAKAKSGGGKKDQTVAKAGEEDEASADDTEADAKASKDEAVEESEEKPVAKKQKKEAPADIPAVVSKTAAPASSADGEGQTSEVSAEAVPSKTEDSPRESFRASFGFRGFNRSLTFSGSNTDSVGQYSAPFAGGVSVDAQWFPASNLTDSFLGNVGVFGQGDFALGLVSRQESNTFATNANRFRLGALVRFPLGTVTLLPHLGYANTSFSIAPTASNGIALRPNIPDVTFAGVRGGLGAHFAATPSISVDVNSGLTGVLSRGELGSDRFFPGSSAFGLDLGAGVSVAVIEHLDFRLGLDYARFFIRLPSRTDGLPAPTSGGDQYIGGSLSAVWRM
jgi:opacity protein-like surface antigen